MIQRRVRSALLLLLALLGGCDRIKRVWNNEALVESAVDRQWSVDSLFLETHPAILFRVINHAGGQVAAPIAAMGNAGMRQLQLGPRGWRAFDIIYTRAGSTLGALDDGVVGAQATLTSDMSDARAQLDTVPGCRQSVPSAFVKAPADARLAITGSGPTRRVSAAIPAGELQAALATIPTLIAPTHGIEASALSRYSREVYTLATGATSKPSLLVMFNDASPVSKSAPGVAERPRQFVVILDAGNFGYRPTFTFATLGTDDTAPRLAFLGPLDVDGDGKAELLFGYQLRAQYDATVVLRFASTEWREVFRHVVNCQD